MKKITIALILFLVMPGVAGASGPDTKTDYVPLLSATKAQTITLPYTFTPIDYSSAGAEDLNIEITTVDFINTVGSVGLTTVGVLTGLGIIGIFVVLMLAIGTVFWLWSLVTGTPHTTTLRVFDAADAAATMYDTQAMLEEQRNPQLWGEQPRALGSGRQTALTIRAASSAARRGMKGFRRR